MARNSRACWIRVSEEAEVSRIKVSVQRQQQGRARMQASSNSRQKAFITSGSPVVPLLSTSKADSGLASEF
jgi:hypothetical protein